MDILLVQVNPSVVLGHDARSYRTIEFRGHRLTLRVVDVTARVARPNPITDRNHTRQVHPAGGLVAEIQLDTHVAGIDTGHVYTSVVAIRHELRTHVGLIHPERVVGVEVDAQLLATQTVATLYREYLLVYSIGVGHVARRRLEEGTTREEGGARDVTYVEEDI